MTINIEDEEIQARAEAFVEKHGISLDLTDKDISEELYDMLAKAFYDKCERLGIEAKPVFDTWTIHTTIEYWEGEHESKHKAISN